MNSNSNIIFKDHFTVQSNLFPQTSTFLSTMIQNPYPVSPSLKLSYSSQKEPMHSLSSATNNGIPSSTGRCLNFDCPSSGSDFNNKFEFTPFQLNSGFANRKDVGQTNGYLLEKLRSDNNMEVEVSDFTSEPIIVEKSEPEQSNQFFQNLIQRVEIPHKGISTSETKPAIKEKYPQPKRKTPSLIKYALL